MSTRNARKKSSRHVSAPRHDLEAYTSLPEDVSPLHPPPTFFFFPWLYMYVTKVTLKRICFFLLLLVFVFILYLFSNHRLSSLADVRLAYRFYKLPTVQLEFDVPHSNSNNTNIMIKSKATRSCKHTNATHVSCLANVFFIGASKCGTTSATSYLSQQFPRVQFVRRRMTSNRDRHKEVHRFDRNTYPYALSHVELADEWASSPAFSLSSALADAPPAVVHYTPHYLYAPSVPFDLKQFLPQPHLSSLRFIVMLRDPVKRALSSYWFQHSHLFTPNKSDEGSMRHFEQLVDAEMNARRRYEQCIGGEQTKMSALAKCFHPYFRSAQLGGRHLDKGIYLDQLQRWWANFPRSAFYISSLETFAANPQAEFSAMLSFIGVVNDDVSIKATNFSQTRLVQPNRLAQTDLPSPQLLAKLHSFFAPYNAKLKQVLPHLSFLSS